MKSLKKPAPSRPLLSFVITGRNDGFMGDFNWRLATTLNFIGRGAALAGRLDEVEVIVVDWNSEIPLHEVIDLVPEAHQITRFLPVPKAIAEPAQKDTHFPDSIVINTGIRRARGEFISQTGSDVVFTAATLNALLCLLEGRYPGLPLKESFMTGARRHIPNSLINRRLPLPEFEAYLNRNAHFLPGEPGGPGHAAPTNMMLMHRDLWHATTGFDERFIYWGFNDIDLTLRVTNRHPFIHLDHFGVNSLHMEHWQKPRDYSPEKMFRKLNPVDNLTPQFRANPDNWGLGDHELAFHSGRLAESLPKSLPPGSYEIWSASLEAIGAEIGGDAVRKAVGELMGQFRHLPIPERDLPALLLLTWYAAARKPRNFVEIGFRYPHAATAVARNAPGAEIFAVVDWKRRAEDDSFFYSQEGTSLIFFVTRIFRQNGHWAYTRFVDGDQPGPVAKLKEDPSDILPIDLALIRATRDSYIGQAKELASLLRPGGAIVITASSAENFQKTLAAVKTALPVSSVINFGDGLNGMVLAAQVPGRQ